jgi:hypothetical protein
MKGLIYIAAVLAVAVAPALCEDQGSAQKQAPAMRPAPPPKNAGGAPKNPGGALKKDGLPKAGPPLSNPVNPLVRLYRATPEERERALEKLPPTMQERIRAELDRFDHMPPEQQQVIVSRAQKMASLPPEKRRAVTQSWQDFQRLPEDRRREVAMVIRRLQVATEEQRNTFLNGAFLTDFSAEEQKMILDLSEVMKTAQ